MKLRFVTVCMSMVAVSQVCGCAYMDFAGGAYESTRSREASSQAATPGGARQTLPRYDDYERERAKLRGHARPVDTPSPGSSASGPSQ